MASLDFFSKAWARLTKQEPGTKYYVVIEGKRKGYFFSEDKFDTEFLSVPGDPQSVELRVTRTSKIVTTQYCLHTFSDRAPISSESVTQLYQHYVDGRDIKGLAEETFDSRAACQYPLCSNVEMGICKKGFNRVSVLGYQTCAKSELYLQLCVEVPTHCIEVNFLCQSGHIKAVSTDKMFGPALYEKGVTEQWIKNDEHFQVKVDRLRTRSLLGFKISFRDTPAKC